MPGDVPYSCMRNALHYKYNATILKDEFLPGKFQHMWNFQFLFYYSSYMGIKKQALLMKLETSLVIRIKMKTVFVNIIE